MKEQTEPEVINYANYWKTLLRTGIKQRFSTIRSEFFMKVAADGPRIYRAPEDLEDIVKDSIVLQTYPEFLNYLKLELLDGDRFKHHFYQIDHEMFIEYFANLNRSIEPEIVKLVNPNEGASLSGVCFSGKGTLQSDTSTQTEEEEQPKVDENKVTLHLIIVGENEKEITADEYPAIIKHELTHACIHELVQKLDDGYASDIRIPASWTDEDKDNWLKDVEELRLFLHDKKSFDFEEFVCEFLMYESDGQTKIQNPVAESRIPKATKPDAKPKVTFRTLTPFDRFQEDIDKFSEPTKLVYQTILNQLREFYNDYDAFLDDVRF